MALRFQGSRGYHPFRPVLSAAGLLLGLCHASAAESVSASPPIIAFSDDSVRALASQYPLARADVQDLMYHSAKRYQGIWLKDILTRAHVKDEPGSYLLFRCLDGYSPIMTVTRALHGQGFIALADARAPQGAKWLPLQAHGRPVTPAPAYLVWLSQASYSEDYPWPYQIVAIELLRESTLDRIRGTPEVARGYSLFTRYCLKCHAVNGVGGTVGPELNVPCNVTEYWKTSMLMRFISQPDMVRRSSSMPSFASLSEADRSSIVRYLAAMASRKTGGRGRCE